MSHHFRSKILLNRTKSALLIIDIQEKILNVSAFRDAVKSNTIKLIEGCSILSVPIFYTEQYPKGLGSTEPTIKEALANRNAIQKMTFSCGGAGELFETFEKEKFEQIIVCGIETHVCVQQSVIDLLEFGFQVNLAADAVSSRKEIDHSIALERMRALGAEVTTTEAILFELLEVCGTDEFKAVSKIVK